MKLVTSLRIREIELKNRIVMSPMWEYSAVDGVARPLLGAMGGQGVG